MPAAPSAANRRHAGRPGPARGARRATCRNPAIYTNPCYFWQKELEEHGRVGVDEALLSMRRCLCTPEYARRLAILADNRERPVSEFGYQTWTGMDRQSAGFAGMTLAEMIKPGVIYLDA